jgi:enediyne biosynthesis protein E4
MLGGCEPATSPLFERMPATHSGVTFNNLITESDSFNVINYEYIYNGAGVGVGDFNNDSLPDLFFSGNQVPSRLYLNRGDFKFEDVTAQAGLQAPHWSTGVALADVNQDGWLDIYLCTAHPDRAKQAPNQLFINQGGAVGGVPRFQDLAASAGLADRSYSTQAAFFDYDLDGDLDVYLLNNALEAYDRNLPLGQRRDGTGNSTDRLYRNDGGPGGLRFTNVSAGAGITTEGWGLGLAIADFNDDGWPDVYCANDFQSNDLLWINNQDGTFTNRIADYLRHQSANSMGVDVADLNNDGRPELLTLDMMPEDNLRQKMMFPKPNYDRYQLNLARGYQPQFIRNALQLNNGPNAAGQVSFSEVGYLAGVYATDWSWAALFADFDHDGLRDLLVTNGYKKDVTNLDFMSYNAQPAFSFDKKVADREQRLKNMDELLGVKKSNFAFKNQGDLAFADVTKAWGLQVPSYSNGAAYADLDRDGDLDLVVNNLNDEALLYRNQRVQQARAAGGSAGFIHLQLRGLPGNLAGLGAKVTLFYQGQRQMGYHSPYRGYKSTVGLGLHFGLGQVRQLDSLEVVWPGGARQVLRGVATEQTLTLRQADARLGPTPAPPQAALLRAVGGPLGLAHYPQEIDFVDYKVQPLLVRKHSQLGPGLAVGDANGDGLDDLFVGGASQQSGVFFYQQPNGTFKKSWLEPDTLRAKRAEDTGVLLFDADSDGDQDLYCASGSSEFGPNAWLYQDRFYRNRGQGKFELDSTALPPLTASGSCAVAADYDRDGDLDLFVGGRVSPGQYPKPPASYLLQNDGRGRFADVTAQVAPALARPGMVSTALWTDYDGDGWPDLLLAGEWLPLQFYHNQNGKKLAPGPVVNLPTADQPAVGWWNSLAGADFDHDGDIDYVAGNLGRNSLYQATPSQPVCLYAKDYDQNGMIDPVLCRYLAGREHVTHYRDNLTEQMVGLKKILPNYQTYGQKTFSDIFTPEMLAGAQVLRANYFSSGYVENLGQGRFKLTALPLAAQLAPLQGLLPTDVDHDGDLDLLAVGNDYSTEVLTGRYDACSGVCLLGDGRGGFAAAAPARSGLWAPGDARALAQLRTAQGQPLVLASQNQGPLLAFAPAASGATLPLRPGETHAVLTLADGRTRREEFYWGSGYLTANGRFLALPPGVRTVRVYAGAKLAREVPGW